jgi:hypothetical protein
MLTETVVARELGLPIPQVTDSAGPLAQFVKDFEKGLRRIESGNLSAIEEVLGGSPELRFSLRDRSGTAKNFYESNQLQKLIATQDLSKAQLDQINESIKAGAPRADIIRSFKPPIDEALQNAINDAYSSDLTAAEIRRLWYQECMIKQ